VTEDEDETLDRIAKVCRAVLTRLHAEISRSINFYRGQQGGGTPTKLFLTGGAALLPQLAEFFQDSLQIEVEFFNPFEVVATAPTIDADALATDAAFLAPTVGLALHAAGLAPIAINLMPESILTARAEVRRIPFVAGGALSLIGAFVCLLLSVGHEKAVVQAQVDQVDARAEELKRLDGKVREAGERAAFCQSEAERLRALVSRRSDAVVQMNAVRQAIGSDLWIDSWQNGKVTIRGWKDRVKRFVDEVAAKAATREGGASVPRTAPEIVANRLKANPDVVAESVKVTDMSSFGKDGCVEQFVVELKFK
jgi:hypothetical protein